MSIYTERRRLGREEVLKHVLAALWSEGRTQIEIKSDVIYDEIFRELVIQISQDFNKNSWIVHLSVPGHNPRIVDADYEIVEETSALPQPPKQLADGSQRKD